VVVQEGFWLADTPCTQAFWRVVTGKNLSDSGNMNKAPGHPVQNVSWDDVMMQFIARFAQRSDWGAGDRLCLPSEVQWEYAARAGSRTAYWWGDEWDDARGNADATSKRYWGDKEGTTPVKRYGPNPWGLYDMHGNVWEWCSDLWRRPRDVLEARTDEDAGVVRGGSWIDHPGYARAAFRQGGLRELSFQPRGFRFALRSPAGPEAR
jgi:formylglycine-generating enzyme required for sulfatase activity